MAPSHASLRAAVLSIALLAIGFLPQAGGPATGLSGGPDGYGYTWTDSRFPNPGVGYSWIEGVTGGIDLMLSDDGCSLQNFGFPFRFYGYDETDAWICANGFLAFDTPWGYVESADLFASGMGTDLNPAISGSGHVFVKTDALTSPRRFIVTWNGVYTYATTNRQTFQIVLVENPTGEDGQILLQYKDVTNPPTSLVGIEDLGNTSRLYYPGVLEDLLAVLFIPPGSGPPGDVLAVAGGSLAPSSVEPGRKEVPFLRLNFSTPTGSVTVRRVRVDVTGVMSAPGDVSLIALWRDSDRNGLLDTAVDAFLAAEAPAGSPEQVSLTLPAPLTVQAGTSEALLVSFDIPLSAATGDWVGAGVSSPTYVTVDPPDTVGATGFPINTYVANTRTRIVEGVDTLQVTSSTALNPANAARWQTDVPMVSLTLDANKGAVTVTGMNVTLLGSPPNSTDVHLGKLYADADGDGILRPGTDTYLGGGRFNVATKVLSVSTLFTVIAGSPRTLWIAYDIAPDAGLGNTVGARVPGAASIRVLGTKDLVSPANLPAGTLANSTIVNGSVPTIVSRWAVRAPTPDGGTFPNEYVLSAQNARNLAGMGGNGVASWLVVENDADYLYVAYDAPGDPTAGGDDAASLSFLSNRRDQFVAGGPLGPLHGVLNLSSLLWEVEDACDPALDANHTGLACVAGFGPSPLDATPHRIYEVRIPLRLLEVPLPLVPNVSLGFAAGSNWSAGVRDGDTGRGSTWPVVGAPSPPAWYGTLVLADAPPVNIPPELNWTGDLGYETDGLAPDSGITTDTYVFRISYGDADGDFPSVGDPRLHVIEGAADIPGSPFSLGEASPLDTDVTDGKTYARALAFPDCPKAYRYYFTAYDDRGGEATSTNLLDGPAVACPPAAPTLSNGTVAPDTGQEDVTTFTWSVEYRDENGDAPTIVNVTILKGGSPIANLTLALQTWLGAPNDYRAGAVYGASRNLSSPGGDYSFTFLANDGGLESTTPPAAGPTVLPEPADTLLVSFSDEAPLIEDAGRGNVKMFLVILQANAGSVDVRSLRIDRAGSSLDSDVAEVRLYHDVDRNGAVTGPDLVLGQGAFATGIVTFSGFFVRVTAGTPEQLIGVIDVSTAAVADNRVGLRVLDATYFGVAPPDQVAPFASFQTTRFIVNVGPTAAGLSIDGFAEGAPESVHVTNSLPVFGWAFSDPNVNDVVQAGYNASVRNAGTGALLWFRNATGTAGTTPYAGPALLDGASYRLDVALADGRVWGATESLSFRMNTPPAVPVLQDPLDGATNLGPFSVVLRWGAVTDAEGDPASYRWSLSTTPDFATPTVGMTVSTSATVPTTGDVTYYWRVEAYDGYEWSAPSANRSFRTGPTEGEIRGRVIRGDAPALGLLAIVRLYNGSSGALAGETTTDANGNYAFPGVPLGVYSLRASSPGYEEGNTTGVVIADSTPVIVDFLLDPVVAETPTDWTSILLWVVTIAMVMAVIGVALSIVSLTRRRRRRPERRPSAPAPAASAPAGGSSTPAPPAATAAEGNPPESEEPAKAAYECPECGTVVSEDATSCPGCGAIFE